ncbi:unnamed protein product, partial [Symbiodinium sp. CCMP2592]
MGKPDCDRSDLLVENVWGVPRSPDEFVKPAELARLRALFFHRCTARARELEDAEQELKKSMPGGHVATILAPKRLLLWRGLMEEFGYPALEVFDVASGVDWDEALGSTAAAAEATQ